MTPAQGAPRVLIDGAVAPQLGRDLTSLTVHAVEGRATAELELLGPSPRLSLTNADVAASTLAVRLAGDEECFSGRLTAMEMRVLDGAHGSGLFAEGPATDGTGRPPVRLRFGGGDTVSGSVRLDSHGATAHCVAGALGLRWGSPVRVTTDDARFDGVFQVVELWHRFDVVRGTTVEFIASQ